MTHRDVIARIQAEYREMPGLTLTLGQVQRLCGIDETMCQAVLDALLSAGFLRRTPAGQYIRHATTPEQAHRRTLDRTRPPTRRYAAQ